MKSNLFLRSNVSITVRQDIKNVGMSICLVHFPRQLQVSALGWKESRDSGGAWGCGNTWEFSDFHGVSKTFCQVVSALDF